MSEIDESGDDDAEVLVCVRELEGFFISKRHTGARLLPIDSSSGQTVAGVTLTHRWSPWG